DLQSTNPVENGKGAAEWTFTIRGCGLVLPARQPFSQQWPAAASLNGGITFTAAQQARLSAVFPNGVCDWGKPGIGQQNATAPLTFAAGPGGVPLGGPPVSTGH